MIDQKAFIIIAKGFSSGKSHNHMKSVNKKLNKLLYAFTLHG